MASNSATRGMMRPHNTRSPPFLVIGLAVVVVILGFNYWSLSSRNSDLATELQDFQDKFRIATLKKMSAERRSDQLVIKVQELDSLLASSKALLKNEKEKLSKDISKRITDLAVMQDELHKYKAMVIEMNKTPPKTVDCPKMPECPPPETVVTTECATAFTEYRDKVLALVEKLFGNKAADLMKRQFPDTPTSNQSSTVDRQIEQVDERKNEPNKKMPSDVDGENRPNLVIQPPRNADLAEQKDPDNTNTDSKQQSRRKTGESVNRTSVPPALKRNFHNEVVQNPLALQNVEDSPRVQIAPQPTDEVKVDINRDAQSKGELGYGRDNIPGGEVVPPDDVKQNVAVPAPTDSVDKSTNNNAGAVQQKIVEKLAPQNIGAERKQDLGVDLSRKTVGAAPKNVGGGASRYDKIPQNVGADSQRITGPETLKDAVVNKSVRVEYDPKQSAIKQSDGGLKYEDVKVTVASKGDRKSVNYAGKPRAVGRLYQDLSEHSQEGEAGAGTPVLPRLPSLPKMPKLQGDEPKPDVMQVQSPDDAFKQDEVIDQAAIGHIDKSQIEAPNKVDAEKPSNNKASINKAHRSGPRESETENVVAKVEPGKTNVDVQQSKTILEGDKKALDDMTDGQSDSYKLAEEDAAENPYNKADDADDEKVGNEMRK